MSSTIDRTITVEMMAKLAMSPVKPEMAAATSRIATSGSAKRLATLRASRRRGASTTAFGPTRASRSAASAAVRPAARLCVSASSVSSGRHQNASVEGSDMASPLHLSPKVRGRRAKRVG
jgi:hypothetical protein